MRHILGLTHFLPTKGRVEMQDKAVASLSPEGCQIPPILWPKGMIVGPGDRAKAGLKRPARLCGGLVLVEKPMPYPMLRNWGSRTDAPK